MADYGYNGDDGADGDACENAENGGAHGSTTTFEVKKKNPPSTGADGGFFECLSYLRYSTDRRRHG